MSSHMAKTKPRRDTGESRPFVPDTTRWGAKNNKIPGKMAGLDPGPFAFAPQRFAAHAALRDGQGNGTIGYDAIAREIEVVGREVGVAVSEAVHEILERIQSLPADERLLLEDQLAQQAETEWRREAEEARRLAREKGIDQAAIDRAVERVRKRS